MINLVNMLRLRGEVLAVETSSAVGDGDKVSCDERIAGLFTTVFCHELP